MKLILAGLLLLFVTSCSSQGTKDDVSGSTFHLHDYKVEELANGLQVIYVEDHSLPSVSLALLIKDGSASDPMAKSGLGELMANVWARGSSKLNASQIADELGQLGTELNHDVSQDYTWFQVSGLTQHGEKLLDIFSDVILHPRFEQQELERERAIILDAIHQRSDHPDQFAAEAFGAYLFGGHPYARPVSGLEADIKTINRTDLFRAYKKIVKPNNAVLVVTGDTDEGFINAIKRHFLAWNRQDLSTKSFPTPPQFKGLNIRLIDKPDLTQSQIIMGQFGIKRSDPDYLLLRVANVILGGNFSSRLMDRVRIKLGLTYGISSSFDAQLDRGPFAISTFTKNQSVGNTITESLKVFKQFYDEGVTDKEVEDAKNYLMGAFPRAIETPERLGFNLALLRLYGIGDDYLKNFVVNVAKISADQVNGAIKAHLTPDDLKIVILSKAQDSLDQVRPLGLLEVKKFNEVF
jgi:zinc protease